MAKEKKYKRILLKLSGEELMGDEGFGIDPKVLDRMALEIGQLVGIGVQVGLVIGGGNLFRAVRRAGRTHSRNVPDFLPDRLGARRDPAKAAAPGQRIRAPRRRAGRG